MENKYTGRIIALMLLMLASSVGGNIELLLRAGVNSDVAMGYSLLIFIVTTVIMMAVPFICRMANKDKLPHKKGKRICLWNSIILFALPVIFDMAFVGGIGAVIFYFVNKWLFVHQYELEDSTGDALTEIPDDVIPAIKTEQPIRACLPTLEKDDTSKAQEKPTEAKVQDQDIPIIRRTVEQQTAVCTKYCSKCGNGIEPVSKVCTGCGRQYFKGIPWKTLGVIVTLVLLVVSVGLNTYMYSTQAEAKETIAELTKKNNNLKSDIADLKKENEQYYDYWVDTFDKMDVFDSWIVFIENDGTNLYHKYDCSRFLFEDSWAHNIEYAEYIGYNPCPRCFD